MAQSATPSPYRIELLAKKLDRASFSSGSEPLDRYLKTQASQSKRRIWLGPPVPRVLPVSTT